MNSSFTLSRNLRVIGRRTNLGVALLSWFLLTVEAEAATREVTTTADAGPGSLRQIMADASPGDTISCEVTGTITLISGQLVLDKSLNIIGPGATNLAISGNYSNRIFRVNNGVIAVVTGLTIKNGKAADGTNGVAAPYPNPATPGGPGEPGGAIYSSGTLTLLNCQVSSSAAGRGGAGCDSPSLSAGGTGGGGGGIYNAGVLTISNCAVAGNAAGAGGQSGRAATYSMVGGAGGSGGGIYSVGSLYILDSAVTQNTAGQGPDTPVEIFGANGGAGGGIWSGSNCVVSGSLISSNTAGNGGAGGGDTWSGGAGGEGGAGGGMFSTGSLAMTSCTLRGNRGGRGGVGGNGGYSSGGVGGNGGSGAGVYAVTNLTAEGCNFVSNSGGTGGTGGLGQMAFGNGVPAPAGSQGDGGGLFCEATNAFMLNCSISENLAGIGGGVRGGILGRCSLDSNVAKQGGGAAFCTMTHCTLTGNATSSGGAISGSSVANSQITQNAGDGARNCVLKSCTIAGNTGLGVFDSTLHNCIVYYNGANYSASVVNFCCTTPTPATGSGNFEAEPQLATASHLSGTSPCLATGDSTQVTGQDIDGEPWAGMPAIGCDEYYSGSATGALGVTITAAYTNVVVGLSVPISGNILGHANASVWDFGDGTVVSNRPFLTPYSWAAPGVYPVVLRAYNQSNPAGVSATVTVRVSPAILYVRIDSATPVAPYASWETAATNIQDAVDLATTGATVLVSNGVYATGGRVISGSTSRVVIPKGVTVQSVNGPQFTSIHGYQLPGSTNGDGAIRCVYVADGGTLRGFTLQFGATPTTGSADGGGVWCESAGSVVADCIITRNAARGVGGGVLGGSLVRCWIAQNSSGYDGGGSYYATLNNCLVVSNTAAQFGGGAYSGNLFNCTVAGNSAGMAGGGTYAGLNGNALRNCIISYNTAPTDANYSVNPYTPPLINCFSGDPRFVNYAASNFRLQSNSPCINAGNNSYAPSGLDLDGRPRIVGGNVDIGAYEYQGPGVGEYLGWLQQYGLPTDASVDNADADADGLNTWQEWRCQTCPTNASSALRLLSVLPEGNNVAVNWQSVTGVNYSLERSTNLASSPQFRLIATNLPGQPSATTFVDTNAAHLSPILYRVKVP